MRSLARGSRGATASHLPSALPPLDLDSGDVDGEFAIALSDMRERDERRIRRGDEASFLLPSSYVPPSSSPLHSSACERRAGALALHESGAATTTKMVMTKNVHGGTRALELFVPSSHSHSHSGRVVGGQPARK